MADLEAVNEIYNQAVRSKYQTAETEETSLEYRQRWYKEHQLDILSGICYGGGFSYCGMGLPE